MLDNFTLCHFVLSLSSCSLCFLSAFTGVFFFFLKILNFEVLWLLDGVASLVDALASASQEGSLPSLGALNLFTLVLLRFQNLCNLLGFFVFSGADTV